MRSIIKKILYVIFFVVLLSSSKDDDLQVVPSKHFDEIETTLSLRISTDSVLTRQEAINVAKLMMLYEHPNTKSASEVNKEIEDVEEIVDEYGDIVMYAINYTNNEGYTIVSATKDYFPIIARVEKGKYDSKRIQDSGVSLLVQMYKDEISYWDKQPVDSLKEIRRNWLKYEEINGILPSSTKSDISLIQQQIASMQAAGAVVYTLSQAESILPADVYDIFYRNAEVEHNHDYDMMAYAVVVETELDYTPSYLLNTTWGQGEPYNYSCPTETIYVETYHCKVGCNAVALAQVMKYHQWPNTFSWNSMPNNLNYSISGPTVLSDYLYDVGMAINTDYGVTASISSINYVYSALISQYNYLASAVSNIGSIANVALKTSINNGRPVILRGGLDKDGNGVQEEGHCWVCDGYGPSYTTKYYTLYVVDYSYPAQLVETSTQYEYNMEYGEIFHMNWGWGGQDNGWFLANNLPSNVNYTLQLGQIASIRPNN